MLGAATLAAPTAAWASSGGCTKSSPCSLAFATSGQPAGTAVDDAIAADFGSQGGPVQVGVLDSSGQLVTNVKAAVTVTITPAANPGSGKLSGTTTVNTSGGVASFSDLSINKSGIGYTLTATSRGMSPAISARFTIWGSLQPCSAGPCSASASTATTAGTVTATLAESAKFLGVGIGGADYTCNGTYNPVSEPFVFDVLTGPGVPQDKAKFTATLRIDKSKVLPSGHPGASSWQICYASMSQFTTRDGTPGSPTTIGDSPFFTGLLPDCSTIPVAPCVQARNKDNAGDVIVTFLASGDPVGKG